MKHVIELKYGTSKGRETYGYGLCTCRVDGKRMGTASGGGYDLGGAAFGEAMSKLFADNLKTLVFRAGSTFDKATNKYTNNESSEALYGLSVTLNGGEFHALHLDGACGFDSMRRIIEALGYSVEYITGNANSKTYVIRPA